MKRRSSNCRNASRTCSGNKSSLRTLSLNKPGCSVRARKRRLFPLHPHTRTRPNGRKTRFKPNERSATISQNALPQQTRVLGPGPEAQTVSPSPAYANSSERPEDAIQAERKKRDYLSERSPSTNPGARSGPGSADCFPFTRIRELVRTAGRRDSSRTKEARLPL